MTIDVDYDCMIHIFKLNFLLLFSDTVLFCRPVSPGTYIEAKLTAVLLPQPLSAGGEPWCLAHISLYHLW